MLMLVACLPAWMRGRTRFSGCNWTCLFAWMASRARAAWCLSTHEPRHGEMKVGFVSWAHFHFLWAQIGVDVGGWDHSRRWKLTHARVISLYVVPIVLLPPSSLFTWISRTPLPRAAPWAASPAVCGGKACVGCPRRRGLGAFFVPHIGDQRGHASSSSPTWLRGCTTLLPLQSLCLLRISASSSPILPIFLPRVCGYAIIQLWLILGWNL